MNAEHLTPEQAREQLAISRSTALHSIGDRRTHALGTALLGLTIGVFMTSQTMVSGAGGLALSGVFVAICVAEAVWVERRARTVPRRAGLWSRLGVGASILLSLIGVLPWLNLRAQSEPITWVVMSLGAVVVALPCLMAAAIIARGQK